MRIALSMVTLAPGAIGGAERYAVSLSRALVEAGEEVTCLVPPEAAPSVLPARAVTTGPSGSSGLSKAQRLAVASLRPGRLWSALGDHDVVHYPLTVPLPRAQRPWVTTLHDVQHRDLPELFPRRKRIYRALLYDRPAREADAVIVPSAFVRDRAVERLGLDPVRVHVVPHGIDHDLFRPGPENREPLLLYPAYGWPHKNHGALFEALQLLRADTPELTLVLTGGGAPGLLPAGVRDLGRVPDQELAALCRRASCLVFPSLYEGFGLPPVEAMACGCPVAASDRGALAETCSGAAVLFDPESPCDIAAGIRSALDNAAGLTRRGLEHAARFTWARAATAHVRVYRSVAG